MKYIQTIKSGFYLSGIAIIFFIIAGVIFWISVLIPIGQ